MIQAFCLTRPLGFLIALACAFIMAACATKATAVEILTLEAVLKSTTQHYPKVFAAQSQYRQSQARLRSSEGGFDTKFEQSTRIRTTGYYDGFSVANKLSKPLRRANSQLFAEYRYADGDFPIYEDEFVTLGGGEIGVGLRFSLLQDRATDEARTLLDNAELDLQVETLRFTSTLNQIQLKAAHAYLDWYKTHRQYRAYQALLQTSLERQNVIKKRVAIGDLAQVELLDNNHNLLKRESQVLKASNNIQAAAIALSMYWRGQAGHPISLSRETEPAKTLLSESPLLVNIDQFMADNDPFMADNAVNHPDIQLLNALISQLENQRDLYQNELLPKADMVLKATQDIGSGDDTREELESYVGLQFSVPLERNKAKGKLAQTIQKIKELQYKQQHLTDTLKTQAQESQVRFFNTQEQVEVSKQLVENAQELQRKEQKRFMAGDSDMLFLNVREEQVAEANIQLIEDEVSHLKAHLELLAYFFQLNALLKTPIDPLAELQNRTK